MKNILIIKFGALGDVVRTSFFLKNLKLSGNRIVFLTHDNSLDLLRFNPYIDVLLLSSFSLERLAGFYFDEVYSLDDEREILDMIPKLTYKTLHGAFIDDENKINYTDSLSYWFNMGLVSRLGKKHADELKKSNQLSHAKIFKAIFGGEASPEFFNSGYIEGGIKEKIPLLRSNDIIKIGINSGSGGRWESKALPITETLKLINLLLTAGNARIRVFLLGGDAEVERHKYLYNSIEREGLVDTGNSNSLLEFAAIIKAMDFIISSDSLALHLAIAQGVKNLSFYAPTSAAEIETFGTGLKIHSLSEDYCSYKKDTDNSTITAERLFVKLISNLWIEK
ncbi:MAG: hypothetical protein K2Y14_06545 [Burkholderiales bacterium]|nr:hypothetical protein [Burkholderiales bacterium]